MCRNLRPSKCIIVPMSAIEGSYSVHLAKGLVGWDHPDLPALILASAVLNATESYLWRSIRGSGLAYGANVEVDCEAGFTGFCVYRVSGQPQVAFSLTMRRARMRCWRTRQLGSFWLVWRMARYGSECLFGAEAS